MEFKKATLQEVSSAPSATPQAVGNPIEVQVNPTSMRLQMANNVDAGKAFARPNTQYQGSSSSTLSFDLVFDTADEGTTEDPVDVRTRTKQLERFLLPGTGSPKAVPPRVQFTYGTFTVVGVMSALNQEFDLFAANGVPLRAKCAVTIKEQKPEFDAKLTGPGANTGAGAQPPVPPSAGTGGAPPSGGVPDRTGSALDGESAPAFASRMGLDPSTWKGLAGGIEDPLRLSAGLQIDFSSSLSAGAGLGVQAGATAATPSSDPRPPSSPVPPEPPAVGTDLTAAGGLSRALDRSTVARTAQAAAANRAAFDPPASAIVRTPTAASSTGVSAAGATTTKPAAAAGAGASGAGAAVVTADPRATSFGFGVPLRPLRGPAAVSAVGLVHELARRVAPGATDGVPVTTDVTVPRWVALAPDSGSVPTGRPATPSVTGCGCGCGGGCGGCG